MQMNNSANKNEKNPSKLYPFLCEKSSAYSFLKNGQNIFQKEYTFCIKILEYSNLCVFFFTTGKPPNIFNNCFLGKFL